MGVLIMGMHTNHSAAVPEPDGTNTAGAARGADDSQELFDAARRRLEAQRRARPAVPAPELPAEAITELAEGLRPIDRYYSGRSARPESLRNYRYKLRRAQDLLSRSGFPHGGRGTPAEEFPWHLVTPAHAAAYLSVTRAHFGSPKSVENLVGVLREMTRYCCRAGLIDSRRRDDVLEELPVRATPSRRVGREVRPEELAALLRSAIGQPVAHLAARDTAVFATLAGTGMRICEAVDIDLADVDLDPDLPAVVVNGKGGEPRVAWLPDGAVTALRDWLVVRGTEPGPFFLTTTGERLTTSGLRQMIDHVRLLAGVAHFTPHDLRRTYITTMLRSGVDPFTVMRAVGHKWVTTTLIYDRRTHAEGRAAVDHIHIPTPPRQQPHPPTQRRHRGPDTGGGQR